MSERRKHECHFLLSFFCNNNNTRRKKKMGTEQLTGGGQEARLKHFQRASGERATVGRLVALPPSSPLSPLSLSLYSSERGRRWGSHPPQHTATSHSAASHYARAAYQEKKMCDSYSLRRSHQSGSTSNRTHLIIMRSITHTLSLLLLLLLLWLQNSPCFC